MSTFRNPVGPQSPATYWRRRLLVLLGLVAVVVVVILIVVRPGSAPADDKAGSSSSEPGGTTADSTSGDDSADAATSDSAATDADPAAAGTCAPGVITVEAVTDKVTYAAGEQPLISMKVTNTGSVACDLPVGTDIQEFLITSGSEKYWSSVDCQVSPAAQTLSIEPGEAGSRSTEPIPWDRTRSDAATCGDGARAAVPAGGASYHLTVSLGELKSESKQILLY